MKNNKSSIAVILTACLSFSTLSIVSTYQGDVVSASVTPAISKKAIYHMKHQYVSYKEENNLIKSTPKVSQWNEYQYKLKKGIYVFKLWWNPEGTAGNRIVGEQHLKKGTIVSAYQIGLDGQDWNIATPKVHGNGKVTYTVSLGTNNATVLKGNPKIIHKKAIKVLSLQ